MLASLLINEPIGIRQRVIIREVLREEPWPIEEESEKEDEEEAEIDSRYYAAATTILKRYDIQPAYVPTYARQLVKALPSYVAERKKQRREEEEFLAMVIELIDE